jgi:hypothetical protein
MHLMLNERFNDGYYDDYDPYDDEHDLSSSSSVTRNETASVTIENEHTFNNRGDAKPGGSDNNDDDDNSGELCEIPLGMESGWAKLGRSILPSWATMPNTCEDDDDDVKNDDDSVSTRVMVDEPSRDTTPFPRNIIDNGSNKDDLIANNAVLVEYESERDEDEQTLLEWEAAKQLFHTQTTKALQGSDDRIRNEVRRRLRDSASIYLFRGMRKKLLDTGKRIIVYGSKQLVGMKGGIVESSNVTTTIINDELTNNSTDLTMPIAIIDIDKDESNATSAVDDASESIDVNNVTISDDKIVTMSNDEVKTIDKQNTRRHRRRIWKDPIEKPIFSVLESKDINETTLWRRRKWERRRRRALVAYGAVKNALLLFVVTCVAGNVMNQFVDFNDDGSIEVHFGKVLSSSTTQTMSPATQQSSLSAPVKSNYRGSLFRAVVTPKKRYYDMDGDRAQALGLVSRAIKRVGPAVVRLE